ncbi:hypothetical protein Tco_1243343 [Tanacetum coccineum]
MFEISGNNFNDWFRQFKMVLRVERKLFVIEQPISLASPIDSEYLRSGMQYMIHNEELKSTFEKQVGVEWFDLIQTFHACKQDEGKPVGPYNMGKTVGELHAMLNEYKKGLPKKTETPQVMMIKGGKIQKANKKSLKAKGKNKVNGKGKDKEVYIPKPKNPKTTAMERPAKDDTCHHYKEVGHCKRNCLAYLVELIKKKKQVALPVIRVWGCEVIVKRDKLTNSNKDLLCCDCFIESSQGKRWLLFSTSYLKTRLLLHGYDEFFGKHLISKISGEGGSLGRNSRRRRYNTSEITSNIPQEGEGFKHLKEVIPIRWSERDTFELHRLMSKCRRRGALF